MRRYRRRDRHGGRSENNRVVRGSRGSGGGVLARISIKAERPTKLRSRHTTLKFRRKAIANAGSYEDRDDDDNDDDDNDD